MSKTSKRPRLKVVQGGHAQARGQQPVEYRVKIAVDVTGVLDGTRFAGEMELPIRRGVKERLDKTRKEDVSAAFRELANMIDAGAFTHAFGLGEQVAKTTMKGATKGGNKSSGKSGKGASVTRLRPRAKDPTA